MSEKLPHPDPRSERSRAALRKAALDLVTSHGLAALTASALCAAAGVARSTLYEHYESPSEPLADALLELFALEHPGALAEEGSQGRAALDPQSLLASGRPLSYPLFAHLERHAEVYTKIFRAGAAGAALVDRLMKATAESSRALHAPLRERSAVAIDEELVASYLAGALVSTAGVWLSREKRPSATEMAYWFSRMAAPGLLEVMGLGAILED